MFLGALPHNPFKWCNRCQTMVTDDEAAQGHRELSDESSVNAFTSAAAEWWERACPPPKCHAKALFLFLMLMMTSAQPKRLHISQVLNSRHVQIPVLNVQVLQGYTSLHLQGYTSLHLQGYTSLHLQGYTSLHLQGVNLPQVRLQFTDYHFLSSITPDFPGTPLSLQAVGGAGLRPCRRGISFHIESNAAHVASGAAGPDIEPRGRAHSEPPVQTQSREEGCSLSRRSRHGAERKGAQWAVGHGRSVVKVLD
ncbi:hypothetical protein P4O66_003404 [Electrophorus voltai]|uniref:Uncharacterized protein n=1 Tax=Electrophorus voltai TaxID=2609070 RepID=A0AAD9DJG0_9TELE|nr:hypothetical protein P4O66_003404 [Electrophorus voltai]